jgi:hypothetical protein
MDALVLMILARRCSALQRGALVSKRQHDEADELTQQERTALRHHLMRLKLADADEYRVWCAEHKLSSKLVKPEHRRRKEIELLANDDVRAAMTRSRTARKDPRQMLERIFEGNVEDTNVTPTYKMVAQLVASFSNRNRAASIARFRELFLLANDRTKLISTAPVVGSYPHGPHNTFLGGLAAIATHGHAWLRPLNEWKVVSNNPGRQFASLVRHLFAQYPVPPFLDSAWFRHSRTQNWFLHVGRGRSIRTAERLYFPLTKREAHEFMLAPDDYTIEQALRWGQMRALNGNRRMVDAVCGTRLCNLFAHNDFWVSVLRFFIQNPFLDAVHYGPIIDYIHSQKFERQEVFVRPGVIEQQPPSHPGFTMRGRTPESLLRQVGAWHAQLGREQRFGPAQWKSSEINGLSLIEGHAQSNNMRRWTITELLNRDALVNDGRAMRHCIATYARSCADGHSSVWSMQCENAEGLERVLTIEVRPSSRMVMEARGKFNAAPTPQSMRILRQWTEKEGLSLATYVAR